MAAVGLFTLDSATLGLLNTSPLGGQGTGFVVGSSTASGSVSGVLGHSGSVTASSASVGLVSGVRAAVGLVAGSSASSGTVTGVEGDNGTVAGVSVSTGEVSGFAGFGGAVVGVTATDGTVVGIGSFAGSVSGSSVSSGTASGTGGDTPVPPPPVPPEGGSWSSLPRFAPPARWVGAVQRGRSRSVGGVTGSCGYHGTVAGSRTCTGQVSGVRYPSDALARTWQRQAHEEALLIAEVL